MWCLCSAQKQAFHLPVKSQDLEKRDFPAVTVVCSRLPDSAMLGDCKMLHAV